MPAALEAATAGNLKSGLAKNACAARVRYFLGQGTWALDWGAHASSVETPPQFSQVKPNMIVTNLTRKTEWG